MRILITGAGGLFGRALVAHCNRRGDDVVAADHGELDVCDRDAVFAAVTSVAPDAVVHGAAWTAVDACESDPDRALRTNSLATRWVAQACELTGAHLTTLSTDYVFDGAKATPYHEWDDTNPLSVYGRSKLGAERETAAVGGLVVRTSWLFGSGGPDIVATVLRLRGEHDTVRFVDDQRGCPTCVDDLAVAVRDLAGGRATGTHHVTNQGAVSWFELVQAILSAAGDDPQRVQPISTAELDPPRAAPRPANSVLDNAVLRLSGRSLLADFREPMERTVKEMLR